MSLNQGREIQADTITIPIDLSPLTINGIVLYRAESSVALDSSTSSSSTCSEIFRHTAKQRAHNIYSPLILLTVSPG
jgi:hypothetical protein